MTASLFLTLSGAVPAEALDLGVAGHYGNPIVEQRKLERGDAIVDLSDRGLVVVTGPDRRSWLHSMASQAVDHLAPGESAEALLLDASGHIEHAVHMIDDGESSWLIVEGAEAAPLAAFLDRMRFMLRVEVADRSAEFAVIAAMSLDALDAAAPAAAPAGVALDWTDPWASPDPAPTSTPIRPATRHPRGTGSSASCRAPHSPTRPPRWRPVASPSPERSPPRRCASPRGARASRPRSTRRRSRTSSTGCAAPSTSARAATRARRRSRRC